jgi:hypothetical protein
MKYKVGWIGLLVCMTYVGAVEVTDANSTRKQVVKNIEQSSKEPSQKHTSNLDLLNEDVPQRVSVKNSDSQNTLELEDERYLQIRGEDMNDTRLPELTLELAQKHMDAKEYLIAEFYVKLYIRDYAFGKALDKAWYIRIKSLFMQFQKSQSQEGLLKQIVAASRYFNMHFLQSTFQKKVASMLKTSIDIAKERNEEIAAYYESAGKKKAAAYYREKNKYLEAGGY